MPPYRPQNPSIFSGVPGGGPVTKALCAALVGVSVIGSFSQRKLGFGVTDLVFRAESVLAGEVWRLLTYAFVKTTPFGLLLGAVVLWLFGRWYEASWGSRDYLRFFFASTIGGAVLAIPLSLLANLIMPFQDLGMAEGPDAAVDAMMVAMALHAPDSKVLFGFVLPVPAKMVVLILLGIDVVSGVMTGASTLSITLGGMLMGYFLVTGNWRPSILLNRLRVQRLRKRRDGLYVVPPRDKHTLN